MLKPKLKKIGTCLWELPKTAKAGNESSSMAFLIRKTIEKS